MCCYGVSYAVTDWTCVRVPIQTWARGVCWRLLRAKPVAVTQPRTVQAPLLAGRGKSSASSDRPSPLTNAAIATKKKNCFLVPAHTVDRGCKGPPAQLPSEVYPVFSVVQARAYEMPLSHLRRARDGT